MGEKYRKSSYNETIVNQRPTSINTPSRAKEENSEFINFFRTSFRESNTTFQNINT